MKTQKVLFAALLLFGASVSFQAQTIQAQHITTAVPFLANAPDARGTALGFCGVATSPDAFSMFYNPAKYAFMQNEHTMIASGFSAFSSLVSDQILLYDAFAQKIGKSAIAATARYYSCGEIEFRDEHNAIIGVYRPREFAIDVAYSYRFGEYFSAGLAGRFIHSNLSEGAMSANAISVAGDVSAYYRRPIGSLVDWSMGAAITNIGTKMSYTSGGHKDFIPTTLRLGTGFKFNFHPKNTLAFNVDFSKLLVPTPPARDVMTGEIIAGYDNNVSTMMGMIQSFYDAPGMGYNYSTGEWEYYGKFYEELCEINTGVGLEYNLADHFFVRTGYYHMPHLKGGMDYLTEGLGMRFGIFGMDISYTFCLRGAGLMTYDGPASYGRLRWNMYFAF